MQSKLAPKKKLRRWILNAMTTPYPTLRRVAPLEHGVTLYVLNFQFSGRKCIVAISQEFFALGWNLEGLLKTKENQFFFSVQM